ncbi:Ldh family oxidoreductase [Alicyclobacillus fastidiosus]|uniref:Ldh family oxidoreductase n=1 Tax=Alicyclobacillus fastidiosus TaxID=392011 RepID=A0ABV5A960_9BACL|nr:Ldh family oxidoreductase [Alicyclobacillus fastidiosus]WEH10740.1 Ldh family oxidoreductase [Alicyclobacillus fastidiosus]
MKALATKFGWIGLKDFIRAVFTNAGVSSRDADIVADSLVQAELRGVESHGVVRLGIYLERVEKGMLDPHGQIECVHEGASSALLDGHNNFGAVIGVKALEVALSKARKQGVSMVGVKGSNHFGIGAYYALKAIEQDMILLVFSNASQTMPPTGGIRPFIGTNPFTVGVPAGKELPFVLDMATSVVARGKIIVAAEKHERIPEGWAINQDGYPTTDPVEALAGAVLPVGGAKGYGMSMFIDILSGVLTGAGFGKYVHNMYENWHDPQNVGHVFMAVDINQFIPLEIFKHRIDTYFQEIKAEPKAPGVDQILIPGEIEYFKTIERKKHGIDLPESVAEQLYTIGDKYSVNLDSAYYLD